MNAYFQTLADADYEAFANLFSEDILYNVSGTTEISGQWIGKEALFGYLNPYVFEHIDAENSNMSTKYKIMCADNHRVVSINEVDGKSKKRKCLSTEILRYINNKGWSYLRSS